MQQEELGAFAEIIPERFASYDLTDPVLFN